MTRRSLAALAGALLLAVLHTWPLATNLSGLSRLDNADTALNAWIVSWVAHALPQSPAAVFDAPIFHPEPRTLAYSEPLLVPGVMAIPLRASGLSAVATYNVLVLLGFALSAWAMWRLVTEWTGDAVAGVVAGMAFAFNAHLLTRFAHLQALHAEFVPLVLLAIDRVVRQRRVRDGVLLGVALALVGLVSIYQLAFMAGAVIVGLLARRGDWRDAPAATWRAAGLGVAIGMLLLSPVLWQYLQVSRETGIVRTLDETARYGATWRDYLASGGRLHAALWSAQLTGTTTALFPGVTVLLLGLAGLRAPDRDRGRVRMCLAIAALGVVLSLGPALPLYGWLYQIVPLLQATRVASRWGVLLLTALAVLAGVGAAALRRTATPSRRLALAWLLPLLVTAEAWRAPMAFTPAPPVPAIYQQIDGLRDAVLLEYPLYPGRAFNLNAPYLLAQTGHFHPIVNGYSGLYTAGYAQRVDDLATFPGPRAQARIHADGITHLVFHLAPLRADFGDAAIAALDGVPWLERVFGDEEARVYRVRREQLAAP